MIAEFLRFIGYGLCHQLPERSFFGGGMQVPVCARDTGIYIGFTLAALLLAALGWRRRPSEIPPARVAFLAALFVASMAADGLTSYAGLRATTNDLRLLTGLMTGFAVAAYAVPLLAGTLLRRPGRGRALGRPREQAAWLAGVPVSFALVRWGLPVLGGVYPVLVTLSILFAFTAVNLVIVGVFRPFERSVEKAGDLVAPVLWASVLTLVEILGSAWLRVALVRIAS